MDCCNHFVLVVKLIMQEFFFDVSKDLLLVTVKASAKFFSSISNAVSSAKNLGSVFKQFRRSFMLNMFMLNYLTKKTLEKEGR